MPLARARHADERMTLRSYLVLLALATLLPVAVFAVVVGVLLVDSQRDTFRHGAQERTLAVLTALELELTGANQPITPPATRPASAAGPVAQEPRKTP